MQRTSFALYYEYIISTVCLLRSYVVYINAARKRYKPILFVLSKAGQREEEKESLLMRHYGEFGGSLKEYNGKFERVWLFVKLFAV